LPGREEDGKNVLVGILFLGDAETANAFVFEDLARVAALQVECFL
jgi:hypothetical protein